MSQAMLLDDRRKPRIALMGEFSAGKSTLSNLLLGARPLPESVTATCLSPVWISQGPRGAVRERLDGVKETVSMGDLHSVPIENTRVIHLKFEAELLDDCDLIDCPGISDPNMPSEVWERLIPEIDAVIWCTHATQAWRQSEAAVWEGIPDEIRQRSLLLITRFDKLKTERDRSRVLTRVKRETEGLFDGIYPIALLQALSAGEDEVAWEKSGAHAFAERLMALIGELSTLPERHITRGARPAPAPTPDLDAIVDGTPERRASLFDMDAPPKPRRVSARPAILDPSVALTPEPEPQPDAFSDPEIDLNFAFMREPEDQPEVAFDSLPPADGDAIRTGSRYQNAAPIDDHALDMEDFPGMDRAISDDALTPPSPPRQDVGVRPITLDRKKPVPAHMEELPTPVAHDATERRPAMPRRVVSAKATRTERPTRKRLEKNPTIARNTEPSLNDLRNLFSQD